MNGRDFDTIKKSNKNDISNLNLILFSSIPSKAGKEIAKFSSGGSFGDISLLENTRRNAGLNNFIDFYIRNLIYQL